VRAEPGGRHDPDLLTHTVATCLGLPGQEVGSQADAIVDYLRGRQLLLILDSCERTVDAHLEHIFGKLGISSRVQLATGLSPTVPSPERPPPPPGLPGP
jgi:non-specific serine/threonine protein kinase